MDLLNLPSLKVLSVNDDGGGYTISADAAPPIACPHDGGPLVGFGRRPQDWVRPLRTSSQRSVFSVPQSQSKGTNRVVLPFCPTGRKSPIPRSVRRPKRVPTREERSASAATRR